MWLINSCNIILGSICVADTMIFKRQAGSAKRRHDLSVQNWVGNEDSCYLNN